MRSKASTSSPAVLAAVTAAGIAFMFTIIDSRPTLAQTVPEKGSTTLERSSEAHKALKLKEPSFETREERLNAKPLDWNSTIGKPTPSKPTPEEEEALRKAQPQSSGGGAPHPDAEAEARKLHPEDWK